MLRHLAFLHFALQLTQIVHVTVEGNCVIPAFIPWKETNPPDSVMCNFTKDVSDNVTFNVGNNTKLMPKYYSRLLQCFVPSSGDTWFALTSNRTLDLEYFYAEWENATLDSIYLLFSCGRGNPTEVVIGNVAVNEYKPEFTHGPYNTIIPELTNVGRTIYSLSERVTDNDIPTPTRFYFAIHPYIIKPLDGSRFFDMPASNGQVTVKQTLDYDHMDQKYFILNISVADGTSRDAKTAYTLLNVTILDDDDQNPVFVKPDCTNPCPVPEYEAIIGLTDTVLTKGPLVVVPDIRAEDRDTLGTHLHYSILSGNQHNLFHINSKTAAITQQRSVLEENLPDEEFRLVIEVAKVNRSDLRDLAIVRIRVKERMPTYNGTVPDLESPPKKSDDSHELLIAIIILGVLLFMLFIALIVIVVIVRQKHKEAIVRPADAKSEPMTEEEELPTDREDHYHEQSRSKEKLMSAIPFVSSGALTYATPSTKPRQLPPLPSRDFATETEDVTKKKRSRRRKKKKEPEIFDGTKEYNMGADPEFFDSTDKSKVKRSTRSYPKETDPQLRLKVPNDEPPNENEHTHSNSSNL